jgi:hypothetical protein
MRWGITDTMSCVDVCMNEIETCNKTSFGPSFVVYLV